MREASARVEAAAVLLGCAVLAIARTLPPMPVGPDAPADRFSAVRSARIVDAIAAGHGPRGRASSLPRAPPSWPISPHSASRPASARTATWSISWAASPAPPPPMRSC